MEVIEKSKGERRRKGSGQVDRKACPNCAALVWIDPRLIGADEGPGIKCGWCGGRVPVRLADVHRPVPSAAPPLRARLSRWRRLLPNLR